MEDDFNNLKFENSEENSINKSPIKQTKLVSTRKRKELINADSDNEENITNKNIALQIINKEESKGDENNDYKNERLASKYGGNKFNTIERNNVGGSPLKNNSTLQEKLKKIFLNRDKLKFQYSKQEIPDNLKYNSDDSESSDISGLRKSRKSRKSDKNSDLNNGHFIYDVTFEKTRNMNIIEIGEYKTKKELKKRLTKIYDDNKLQFENDNNFFKFGLIIGGSQIEQIFLDTKLLILFLNISTKCSSVILCRASPKQKAQVVKLIKEKDRAITMAIGDGANDVGMITESNVGIGIQGIEGYRILGCS